MIVLSDGAWERPCMGKRRQRFSVAVDFDGVLHSYISGFQGLLNMPDPPVPGAIEWLTALHMKKKRVTIHSTRLNHHDETLQVEVIEAMRGYLLAHGCPPMVVDKIEFWTDEGKPNMTVFVDDRGFRFTGTFPTDEELEAVGNTWNHNERIKGKEEAKKRREYERQERDV